jgi:hypothetical protein
MKPVLQCVSNQAATIRKYVTRHLSAASLMLLLLSVMFLATACSGKMMQKMF